MMNPDHRKRLDEMIERYLANECGFTALQREYTACYIDDVAEEEFTSDEIEYEGEIHEKAEWTGPAPDTYERSVAWLDVGGFRQWLGQHVRTQPDRRH